MLTLLLLIASGFALFKASRTSESTFMQAAKGTKTVWLGILGAAVFLALVGSGLGFLQVLVVGGAVGIFFAFVKPRGGTRKVTGRAPSHHPTTAHTPPPVPQQQSAQLVAQQPPPAENPQPGSLAETLQGSDDAHATALEWMEKEKARMFAERAAQEQQGANFEEAIRAKKAVIAAGASDQTDYYLVGDTIRIDTKVGLTRKPGAEPYAYRPYMSVYLPAHRITKFWIYPNLTGAGLPKGIPGAKLPYELVVSVDGEFVKAMTGSRLGIGAAFMSKRTVSTYRALGEALIALGVPNVKMDWTRAELADLRRGKKEQGVTTLTTLAKPRIENRSTTAQLPSAYSTADFTGLEKIYDSMTCSKIARELSLMQGKYKFGGVELEESFDSPYDRYDVKFQEELRDRRRQGKEMWQNVDQEAAWRVMERRLRANHCEICTSRSKWL